MSRIQVTKKHGIQQESSLINQLLFRYLPYWPLFVVMLVLGAAGAYTYIRYKVPEYQASASILIKDEKKGVDDSKAVESFNLFGSKKIVENEIEMIRSRTLLMNVVEKLHLYAPVYEEGKVNIIPAFSKSPVELELRDIDSLIPAEKIYFGYDKVKKVVNAEGKEYPLGEWVNSPYGTIRFIANPNYRQPAEEKPLFLSIIEPKQVIDYLDMQLTITPSSKLSSVINISIKDPVPARGKLILKEMINQYDRASVTDKNQLAIKTLDALNERIHVMQKDLDSVDRNIEKYRTENNIVDISTQGQ
ncbi:MAG: capsular biosynthesis protein, partial [Chitinophagaceae bacterium]|nr:capsular biosynthesis protein [Chitinophagaceae bacterium]